MFQHAVPPPTQRVRTAQHHKLLQAEALVGKVGLGVGGGRGYLRPAKSQLLLMAAGGAVDGGRVEQGYFRPAESKSAVGLVGVHAKI